MKPTSHDCQNCESRKDNLIFCHLPNDALEIIDRSKSVNHYKRGQSVYYAGNFPPGLYCITKGTIKLEATSASGNNHILRMARAGSVLGYRSLFADEAYGNNAVVHEDATICFIPKNSILELIEKQPTVALNLLKQVSRELRGAEDRMQGMVDKDASERVAEALLFLKENFQEQTWTRREIAEWAGTSPETVMRTLASFEDEGLIDQKGRKIEIRDRKKLLTLAKIGC